jgi:elongation factor P
MASSRRTSTRHTAQQVGRPPVGPHRRQGKRKVAFEAHIGGVCVSPARAGRRDAGRYRSRFDDESDFAFALAPPGTPFISARFSATVTAEPESPANRSSWTGRTSVYETSAIRKGLKVEIDGDPYVVTDFQFVKPGKGNAFTRVRIKNMVSGAVLDKTYKSGEKLKPATMDERPMQYLYRDEEGFHFMDQQSYEQLALKEDEVGDDARWLLENATVSVLLFNGRPLSISLPNFVELAVAETDPGVRGDTATGGRKSATLSTGAVIQVPLFIERGERLRIDTRSGEYVERVK